MLSEIVFYLKLFITLFLCSIYIPFASWRLLVLLVTGRLNMNPLFRNINADTSDGYLKLIYSVFLVLLALFLTLLGFLACVRILLEKLGY